MSTSTSRVAEKAVELAELREFYDDRAVATVARHDDTAGGRARAAAYPLAIRCRELVEELEKANDALLAATRDLRW